jgi:SAM-dependent methyltransferase
MPRRVATVTERHRASPSIWNPDWYVLRELARAIRATLAELDLNGARVLDYGCGARPYEPWFIAGGARYQGADLDGAHEVGIAADGALDAPSESADLVASFQVLEHVWDVARYLQESHRVLVPGGRLLLSTHGTWLYHPHPGDFRRWTADGLKREIEAAGFVLVSLRPVAGPLAWTTVLRSIGLSHFLAKIPGAGGLLAAMTSCVLNLKASLEDRITPDAVIRDNACIYVGVFRRVP